MNSEREERETEIEEVVSVVKAYGLAVAESVKAANHTGEGRPRLKATAKQEREALIRLLQLILGRAPDDSEIEGAMVE